MIDKLVKMAKQNFDLAFLIAEKSNLETELFNALKGDYDITLEHLRKLINIKEYYYYSYYTLCYNVHKLYLNGFCLTTLDLSNKNSLKTLNCANNNLTQLDISNNEKITILDCCVNNLTTIKLNKNIEELYCNTNRLNTIDITNCKELTHLLCNHNNISNIYLDSLKLTILSINNN